MSKSYDPQCMFEIEVDGPGSTGKVQMALTENEHSLLCKFAAMFNTDPDNQYHASPYITIKRVI
jgi:hypothetical protein